MMIQETNMTLVLQKIFVRYSKEAWAPITIKAADQGNFVSWEKAAPRNHQKLMSGRHLIKPLL